jgi:hypothetical protein
MRRVTATRRRQRHNEDPARDLRAHEPVRWRLGRIEQRVTGPYIPDVVDPKVRVLEQVRGLDIDLERILIIEEVGIEPLVGHTLSLYYKRIL